MCLGSSASTVVCHVGMAASGAPAAESPGMLLSCSPQLPPGVLAVDAGTGHGGREGTEVRRRGRGGGRRQEKGGGGGRRGGEGKGGGREEEEGGKRRGEEEGEEEEEREEGGGRGRRERQTERRRGSPTAPNPAVWTAQAVTPAHSDLALSPAQSSCSVNVVELNQVYLGNRVYEEEVLEERETRRRGRGKREEEEADELAPAVRRDGGPERRGKELG